MTDSSLAVGSLEEGSGRKRVTGIFDRVGKGKVMTDARYCETVVSHGESVGTV